MNQYQVTEKENINLKGNFYVFVRNGQINHSLGKILRKNTGQIIMFFMKRGIKYANKRHYSKERRI